MTSKEQLQGPLATNCRQGFLIVINGPSSSGKSTLADAIQKESNEIWWSVSVDAITAFATPSLKQDNKEHESHLNILKKLVRIATQLTRRNIEDLLTDGHNVIFEIVCQNGYIDADYWKSIFNGYPAIWVGLDTNLDELERRESIRGDRLKGLAAWHKQRVHRGIEYNLFFETTYLSPREAAHVILQQLEPEAYSKE